MVGKYQRHLTSMKQCKMVTFFTLIAFMLAQTISSHKEDTTNNEEQDKLFEWMYYRLNCKINFNPILRQIVKNSNICSSKLGPYCVNINHESLQQFEIQKQQLTEPYLTAYKMQKKKITKIQNDSIDDNNSPAHTYLLLDEMVKRQLALQIIPKNTIK